MTAPTAGTALELYRAPGEGGALSGMDAQILDIIAEHGGRISGEEIAKRLNVATMTPARCVQRAREILHSQDIFSITEQKSLLLLDFVRLRDTLFERVEGTERRFNRNGEVVDVDSSSAWASALIRLLREWRNLIDSMQADIDSDQLQIREAHAKIMMEAITAIFENFVRKLEEFGRVYDRMPSRIEMNELMEESLPVGFQTLERKTAA